jgi:aspartate carbamoyltransferase regulatory subunit
VRRRRRPARRDAAAPAPAPGDAPPGRQPGKAPAPDRSNRSYRVAKLRSGTVVDHLPAGRALRCLAVLGVPSDGVVTVGLNLPSKRWRRKDILKMEGRVLTAAEMARIALLGPRATVVVIEEFRVVKKIPLELPTVIDDVVRCPNPSCITHHDPVTPRARVEGTDPVRLRCHYCERRIRPEEVEFLHGARLPE